MLADRDVAQGASLAPMSAQWMPRRVFIVGGPGSGKTTLANRIGRALAMPVYDLDAIAYEDGAGQKRELGPRRADAEQLARMPGWVAEGIYLWWTQPLAERADRIAWLDVPWRVAAFRIVRRHVLADLAGANRHPGLKKLAQFMWGARRYYVGRTPAALASIDAGDDGAITRIATEAWLRRYSNKVTRCQTTSDLDELIAGATARATQLIKTV